MGWMTDTVARFCADVQYEDLTPAAVEKAKMAIVDTYGVIFTGYRQPVTELLLNWVRSRGGIKQSSVLGYQFKTTVSQAAMLNGTMGHAIDYDDVSLSLRGHPSVVIFPVVFAVGEEKQLSGKEILLAFTLGVEVMVKLSKCINPSHYLKGWHSTATLGVIGAAVAAGKLYGFDEVKMKKVLGLSASMVSGMRLNFGTMTKPFHVGYAAKNGIEAAELVDLGFTANEQILDTKISLFHLYGDETVTKHGFEHWGKPWEVEDPGFNIKRYPCCYATHRAADAAENIVRQYPIDPSQVEKVECYAPLGSTAPLIYDRPKTGLEGKFSMQYVVAAMLVDGRLAIDTFTDEMINRAEIQRLLPNIHVQEREEIKEDRNVGELGHVQLVVKMKDGTTYKEKVHFARGSYKNPLTKSQLYEKFSDCLRDFDQSEIKNQFQKLMNLEAIGNIRELLYD